MTKIAVIQQSLELLPFDKEILSWQSFQRFCVDVLAQQDGVYESREYLDQGSRQDGIDIYLVHTSSGKKSVAECKRENYLPPSEIATLIDRFLTGQFVEDTREFILCTTCDLDSRAQEQALEAARKKLAEKNIQLKVWDRKGLSAVLRNHPMPQTVYFYFKEDIAKAFYGDLWKEYLKPFRPLNKVKYPLYADYLNRTIIPFPDPEAGKPVTVERLMNPREPVTLIQVFESGKLSGKKIVLLSTAGYGKTSELNQLAAHFSAEDKPVYPVRFFLRDYEGQLIEDMLNNCPLDLKSIPGSSLLLLFDGLDEIKEQQESTFINHLNAFMENNREVNTLVTSRFNAYDFRQEQLRGFTTWLLEELSEPEINRYLNDQLAHSVRDFRQRMESGRFQEYINHPYYLTRIVRFYKEDPTKFPQNKSELFNRLLFERLEKDASKYKLGELKNAILAEAEKIAFCMTVSGNRSISENELVTLVPSERTRASLKKFCILNLNESGIGQLSFEHQNLQEYLCASLLKKYSFEQIQEHISFSFNRDKMLPRLLNSISFLFELLDKNENLFDNLFKWINDNQPELFIRFEKEQIDPSLRREILLSILAYYEKIDLTISVSTNFSYRELSDFAAIDHGLILTLKEKITQPVSSDLAFDITMILSGCNKKYVFKDLLSEIYLDVINTKVYEPYVKANAAISFAMLDLGDPSRFARLLASPLDIENYDIRRKLILALEFSTYGEEYIDFVFGSIPVFEQPANSQNYITHYSSLVGLILSAKDPYAAIRLLQYCIDHQDAITRRHNSQNFHLDLEELTRLLERLAEIYPLHKQVVPKVYRILVRTKGVFYDERMLTPFKKFFAETCGLTVIFLKMFRYGRNSRHVMEFATEEGLDHLVSEHLDARLADRDVIIIQNQLSWENRELMQYFSDRINAATGDKFLPPEDDINLSDLYQTYLAKNQHLVLDRDMFLEEARAIFSAVGKSGVSYNDLHDFANKQFRPFQYSIVKEELSDLCLDDNSTVTYEELVNIFAEGEPWESFSIMQVKEHLQNKQGQPTLPKTLKWAKDWFIQRTQEISLRNCIRDNEDGGVNWFEPALFLKELYLLIDVQVPDAILLDMLETDMSGLLSVQGDEMPVLAQKISNNISDKYLFEKRIIDNIRSGTLATEVLFTHFSICARKHYQDILPELYSVISGYEDKSEFERRHLTDMYLLLGGSIGDFRQFIKVPAILPEAKHLLTWEWLLLEKFVAFDPQFTIPILIRMHDLSGQTAQAKGQLIRWMMRSGDIRGLKFFADFIQAYHHLPYDSHNEDTFQAFVDNMDLVNEIEALNLLLETLDYTVANNLLGERSNDSIAEFIYMLLIVWSARFRSCYTGICQKYTELIGRHVNEPVAKRLTLYLERFNRRFFENVQVNISIADALTKYEALSAAE